MRSSQSRWPKFVENSSLTVSRETEVYKGAEKTLFFQLSSKIS